MDIQLLDHMYSKYLEEIYLPTYLDHKLLDLQLLDLQLLNLQILKLLPPGGANVGRASKSGIGEESSAIRRPTARLLLQQTKIQLLLQFVLPSIQ